MHYLLPHSTMVIALMATKLDPSIKDQYYMVFSYIRVLILNIYNLQFFVEYQGLRYKMTGIKQIISCKTKKKSLFNTFSR